MALQYDFSNSVGYWITSASHAIQRALNEEVRPHGITTPVPCAGIPCASLALCHNRNWPTTWESNHPRWLAFSIAWSEITG